MTDAAKAVVWSAVYSPFGAAYTITGAETLYLAGHVLAYQQGTTAQSN